MTETIASSSKREPLLQASLSDPDLSLHVQREHREIRVVEALGGLDSGAGRVEGRVELAHRHVLERERHHQIPTLDAVVFLALEQALQSSEPASGPADLATDREVHPEPEAGTHRAQLLSGVEQREVEALEHRQVLVVPADHRRGRREQLQVLGAERSGSVGTGQRFVRVLPRPLRVRLAPAPKVVDGLLHVLDGRTTRRLPSMIRPASGSLISHTPRP